MKMKTVYAVSAMILLLSVIGLGIHRFLHPFPDLAVRIAGVILLLDLGVFSYCAVKSRQNRK